MSHKFWLVNYNRDSGPDNIHRHRRRFLAQMDPSKIFLHLKLQFYHYDSVNISLVDRPKSSWLNSLFQPKWSEKDTTGPSAAAFLQFWVFAKHSRRKTAFICVNTVSTNKILTYGPHDAIYVYPWSSVRVRDRWDGPHTRPSSSFKRPNCKT